MTEAEIILFMVKCVPVLLALAVFVHLLSDEYLRALEARGLVRRRTPESGKDKTPPDDAAAGKK